MSNILINGLKSKTGGGKSILSNYLALLKRNNSGDTFFVLTPMKEEYDKYSCDSVHMVDIAGVYKHNLAFSLTNHLIFPRLLRDLNIDAIFNLGDIVIPTTTPQLYLFDWPYAVYPDSSVWETMDKKSYWERKIKLLFFKKYIRYATMIVAQTLTMKNKLESIYDLKCIEVIPNAVSLDNISSGELLDFSLPTDRIKLLYLTYYYSHKNLEVFLPLAKKIKELALPYCIITTIEPAQHRKAAQFLDALKKEHLDDIILNLGPVDMKKVASLYSQCNALLMPSLLETYGLPYVEAMHHQKTVLTSDMDFARDVCGGAAFYFNPLEPDSILNAIETAFHNDCLRNQKIREGNKKLDSLLTWDQVFERYQATLKAIARET